MRKKKRKNKRQKKKKENINKVFKTFIYNFDDEEENDLENKFEEKQVGKKLSSGEDQSNVRVDIMEISRKEKSDKKKVSSQKQE